MIETIRQKVSGNRLEYAQHAVDQSIQRYISIEELRQAIAIGEIIEDYPSDKYGSSYLVLGYTRTGRPLHVQCSYPTRELIKIITVYQPDPYQWIDFRLRRLKDAM